jgi:pyruvate dehydrogenase E2 component (dihydrolipoamide acetyltransferase)
MEVEMKMPDLATTGSPIKVVRWLVAVGQQIERGQSLLEVETDKAVMEVESLVTGRLIAICAGPGEEAECGTVVARFESQSARYGHSPSSSPVTPSLDVAVEPKFQAEKLSMAHPARSFFARNREAKAARTTGNLGAVPAPSRQGISLSLPERYVARLMQQSKQTIPHFYLQTSANAEGMAARRMAGGRALLWDAFFVHAAGKALKRFERFSHRFENDQLIPHGVDAVGLAVDLEGELFTLALESPATKSSEQISGEIVEGIARLRSGDPRARLSRRANITVSNLGGSGVESFAAVINPPESAILAVGKVMPQVCVIDGQGAVQQRVNLTLSVDHRIASGKYAAEFLGAIVQELERF